MFLFCLLLAGSWKQKNCVQLPPKWHHEEVEGPSWDSLNSYIHRDDCPTMSSLTSGFTLHKYLAYIESYPCQGLLYQFVWFCPGSVNPPWRVDVIEVPTYRSVTVLHIKMCTRALVKYTLTEGIFSLSTLLPASWYNTHYPIGHPLFKKHN